MAIAIAILLVLAIGVAVYSKNKSENIPRTGPKGSPRPDADDDR